MTEQEYKRKQSELSKLTIKALKAVPGSRRQLELRSKINALLAEGVKHWVPNK